MRRDEFTPVRRDEFTPVRRDEFSPVRRDEFNPDEFTPVRRGEGGAGMKTLFLLLLFPHFLSEVLLDCYPTFQWPAYSIVSCQCRCV